MFKKKHSETIHEDAEQSPENVEQMARNEKVILLIKKHPMVLYKLGVILVGFALVIVGLIALFGLSRITSVAIGIYVLIGGYIGFKEWYFWWASHYLVTNERVVSIDQKGFFRRIVSEAPLEMIMNVSYEIDGPYQTFLDYGTVRISTAGRDEADMEFDDVPRPHDIQQTITRLAKEQNEDGSRNPRFRNQPILR